MGTAKPGPKWACACRSNAHGICSMVQFTHQSAAGQIKSSDRFRARRRQRARMTTADVILSPASSTLHVHNNALSMVTPPPQYRRRRHIYLPIWAVWVRRQCRGRPPPGHLGHVGRAAARPLTPRRLLTTQVRREGTVARLPFRPRASYLATVAVRGENEMLGVQASRQLC